MDGIAVNCKKITIFFLIITSLLTSCASTNKTEKSIKPAQESAKKITAQGARWTLRMQNEQVMYRGQADFDKAGIATAPMSYPAPNAAGFLVSVIAHGVINETAKNSQKKQLQEEADAILEPYKDVLDSYSHEDLAKSTVDVAAKTNIPVAKLITEKTESNNWVVESTPFYSIPKNQDSIVLENHIKIYGNSGLNVVYQNVVKVISDVKPEADVVAFWGGNNGQNLKNESGRLALLSLDVVRADLNSLANNPPYQTLRYMQGSTEKIERAQLLSQGCGRVVIRNLRGQLVSAPSIDKAGVADGCVEGSLVSN